MFIQLVTCIYCHNCFVGHSIKMCLIASVWPNAYSLRDAFITVVQFQRSLRGICYFSARKHCIQYYEIGRCVQMYTGSDDCVLSIISHDLNFIEESLGAVMIWMKINYHFAFNRNNSIVNYSWIQCKKLSPFVEWEYMCRCSPKPYLTPILIRQMLLYINLRSSIDISFHCQTAPTLPSVVDLSCWSICLSEFIFTPFRLLLWHLETFLSICTVVNSKTFLDLKRVNRVQLVIYIPRKYCLT